MSQTNRLIVGVMFIGIFGFLANALFFSVPQTDEQTHALNVVVDCGQSACQPTETMTITSTSTTTPTSTLWMTETAQAGMTLTAWHPAMTQTAILAMTHAAGAPMTYTASFELALTRWAHTPTPTPNN
jgi:hypothetical protein